MLRERTRAVIPGIAALVLCGACAGSREPCTQRDLDACSRRCKSGHAESCAIAAAIWDPLDRTKSTEYFLRACLHGYATGCYGAGLSFMLREPPSLLEAARSFEAGCHLRHADSCAMQAAALEATGIRGPETAFGDYDRACATGSGVGCTFAGQRLASGRGTAQNEALGLELLSRACRLGEPTACEATRSSPPVPPGASGAVGVDGGAPSDAATGDSGGGPGR